MAQCPPTSLTVAALRSSRDTPFVPITRIDSAGVPAPVTTSAVSSPTPNTRSCPVSAASLIERPLRPRASKWVSTRPEVKKLNPPAGQYPSTCSVSK
jgi:hypothetical protein